MERLVTVKVMQERYGCSLPTARKYIRQCKPHMENPLAAPEWAVREWESGRTVMPENKKERERVVRRMAGERLIIPRHR